LKYIFVPLGSAGDVNPITWLAQLMARRGHDVVVVAHAGMAHVPARAGLRTVAVGKAADHDAIVANPDLWHPDRAFNLLAGTFADRAREVIPAIRAEVVPGKTVLVAAAIAVGARIAAEADSLPLVSVQLQPSVFMSEDDRPLLDPRLAFLERVPRWAWKMVLNLVHKAIDLKVAGPVNTVRAELGLSKPVRGIMRDWWMSRERVLALFPDWYAPRRADWPPQTVLTRFPLYDGDSPLDPAAQAFLAEGSPPILFTPGSANMWGRSFFEAAAAACARLGRRGMLVSGYSQHVPGELPQGVRAFGSLPFGRVFARCAAVVHHGGVGTSAQGLAAGVPQLIMPMAHDQPDQAQRLKRLGVGDYLLPKHFRADAVAARLENLLNSKSVEAACAKAKALMAAQMPPERVADLLQSAFTPAMRATSP
jgi:UDP:flavonoid glycosyltransferase YjiC (YdhE family)